MRHAACSVSGRQISRPILYCKPEPRSPRPTAFSGPLSAAGCSALASSGLSATSVYLEARSPSCSAASASAHSRRAPSRAQARGSRSAGQSDIVY
eukprot:1639792-Prymnesium_polylepis.1